MKFLAVMLLGLLVAGGAKADFLFSSSNSNVLDATASEATTHAGNQAGQYYRVSFLNYASGYVGFSATPYSATAATNPVYIPPANDVFIDAKRRAVIIHYVSEEGGTVVVEEIEPVK